MFIELEVKLKIRLPISEILTASAEALREVLGLSQMPKLTVEEMRGGVTAKNLRIAGNDPQVANALAQNINR